MNIHYVWEAANEIDYNIISYYSLNLSFMTKNYYKQVLLAIGLLATMNVSAVELPYAKAPADGKTYILASRVNPGNYLRKTSWDGSLYLGIVV